MNTTSTAAMKFSVEVVILPVRDVDRALRFYVDQVALDVDYSPIEPARPAQSEPEIARNRFSLLKRHDESTENHWRDRFLVVSFPMKDLLLCAKHLFVAATLCSGVSCTRFLPPRC